MINVTFKGQYFRELHPEISLTKGVVIYYPNPAPKIIPFPLTCLSLNDLSCILQSHQSNDMTHVGMAEGVGLFCVRREGGCSIVRNAGRNFPTPLPVINDHLLSPFTFKVERRKINDILLFVFHHVV